MWEACISHSLSEISCCGHAGENMVGRRDLGLAGRASHFLPPGDGPPVASWYSLTPKILMSEPH